MSLDINDPIEARLGCWAHRIGQFLAAPTVMANSDVESSLDDFLGAVYALIRAKKKRFHDRPGRRIKIKPSHSGHRGLRPAKSTRMACGSLGSPDSPAPTPRI